MSKRILIALTSHDRKGDTGQPTGAYLPELAHPHAIFVAAGHQVDFVSVRGGAVPLDGVTDPDATSAAFLADASLVRRLHSSAPSSAVRGDGYDAIFFAGGHGTMWDFADDPGLQRLAAEIYEAGGVVGAVCHGPAALVHVRLSDGSFLVAGKEVSAFTNEEERAVRLDRVVPFLLEDRLVAAGARFSPGPMWKRKVSVAGRLVTGQNPASAAGVAEAMVEVLARSGGAPS